MRRSSLRKVFAVLVVLCVSFLAWEFVTSDVAEQRNRYKEAYAAPGDPQVAPPRNATTVIVSDKGFSRSLQSAVIALAPDGSVMYFNDTYSNYMDVDPVPGPRYTVEYAAAERIPSDKCASAAKCSRMVLERLNLTSGETEVLFSRLVFSRHLNKRIGPGDSEWHDMDHINGSKYVVGDIGYDRVFVLDIDTGITTWEWKALTDFPLSGGEPHPGDWTHLNDIDYLGDGRMMASVRNQDSVVFLNRSGLMEDWTLGEDGNHDILYNQHNPDYIPPENGGPALIVADSENNRAVEYQRVNGSWERTWVWADRQMRWTRDADRLPNGHTLISDSHGNRVMEVNRDGEVVWETTAFNPYDAERLGTGSGSTGGPSAVAANLSSHTIDISASSGKATDPVEAVVFRVRKALPSKIVNGLLFILPAWVSDKGVIALAVLLLTGASWAGLELYWMGYGLRFHMPVSIRRTDEDDS